MRISMYEIEAGGSTWPLLRAAPRAAAIKKKKKANKKHGKISQQNSRKRSQNALALAASA